MFRVDLRDDPDGFRILLPPLLLGFLAALARIRNARELRGRFADWLV